MRPIYLANSIWLTWCFALGYASLFLSLALVDWPALIRVLLAVPIFIEAKNVIIKYGLVRHRSSVIVLQADCDKWLYQLYSQRQCKGRLITARSFRSSLLLIMYIQSINGGRYIVIPRDAVSQHNYRFLAMHLN